MPESHDAAGVFEETAPRSLKAAQRHARRAAQTAKKCGAPPLVAKTSNQGRLISVLRDGDSVFAVGGAGTGKTYIPARIAAQRLMGGLVEKIIICRPTAAPTRHANGFLPGKLDAKLAPWLIPVMDGIRAEVSGATLDKWKDEGRFETVSFEHMRGRTFDGAFVLLDEAQNCTWGDLRMFLSRTGKDTQIAVTGDIDQIDIHDSGLEAVLEMIEDDDLPAHIIRFTDEDVVRSEFAKAFVRAFAKRDRKIV